MLQDDDGDRAIALLDATQNNKELDSNDRRDILRVAREEFEKMDTNNDGIIQAREFDKDL